jgi:hypothetical protein
MSHTAAQAVPADTCISTDENQPNLKMAERPDWALFRSIEGLQQKAGVPAARLRRLVLKELTDNALDAGGEVDAGRIGDELLYVEDDGPGFAGTPEEIASLFSISRPMRSSKLLRLPQRGALGNGLRVVAGAVLASEGSLTVITRNERIKLRPDADGSTKIIQVVPADRQIGTRIEIGFGSALPLDANALAWALAAIGVAEHGDAYGGKSSPHWYDAVQFHELLLAHGSQPARSLIAQLDGCSGGKAGEIIAAAGLDRMACCDINRQQAAALLEIARKQARLVSPDRLGCLGRDALPGYSYAIELDTVTVDIGGANIPIVVEVWARKIKDKGGIRVSALVNRTPVISDLTAWRDSDKDIRLSGCGLNTYCENVPTKGEYDIYVSVITPYCPIVSDGKAPNLDPFGVAICDAITVATKKAQRAAPCTKRLTQKDVVLKNLDEIVAEVSGEGQYRFNERQLFYRLRPIVLEQTGQELQIGNFKNIITDYENENGEIGGMYREPRGSIYHPHRGQTITLGTLMVEEYERPIWTFNKLVYIEKEGFSEALKDNGWGDRHDCAVMSSKGYTTRAARDLVDKLVEHDEPCTVFCVHDADAYGTMIHQTFQEATRARGARKVKIVNLGLEPWEAVANGFEVEIVAPSDKRKAVADYVLKREDGDYWEEWLQTHRVEINAMTTPEFIEWLDSKVAARDTGKLIPPAGVIERELEAKLEASARVRITEHILAEADLEGQISKALQAIERPGHAELIRGIKNMFADSPEREWRDYIETVVDNLSKQDRIK